MEKTISYQNQKIVYHTYGSGKSVMLVHGFGEDGNIWKSQIEFLKEKFHIIVPDLPGSGQSEMIDDMSMDGMAEVLHSIIHEETPPQTRPKEGLRYTHGQLKEQSFENGNNKISESSKVLPFGEDLGEACTLIGHSMGGYITLAFAKKYWNHLHAFGLFHSTAFADSEEKKSTRKKGIEFIKQHGAFEFLKTATPNLFSEEFKENQPVFTGEYIKTLNNFSPAALVKYYEAMMERPDLTVILKNTNVPILFIMGKYDNAVPLNDGLKQCHLPGKTYFHILKHSGHMGMLEESATTNSILERFLQEN